MKNTLIIILTLIILLNFIVVPKKVEASGGLALGLLFGTDLGTKILAFLYACLAVGVTFNAVEEAKAMFDKWQIDSNNWEPPSDGGGGNGWRDVIQGILAGAVGSNAISNLIDSVKSFIQDLGAEEGENIWSDGVSGSFENINYLLYDQKRSDINFWYINANINGNIHRIYGREIKLSNYEIKSLVYCRVDRIEKRSDRYTMYFSTRWQGIKWGYPTEPYERIVYYEDENLFHIMFKDLIKNEEVPDAVNLPYNVEPNSTVITDIPPATLPQPEIDLLPIKEEVLPTGESVIILDGTDDEIIDVLINEISFDDVYKTSPDGYTIVETDNGKELQKGQTSTSPYPNPDETPSPEDTLTGLQTIISLLKSIINWISQIPNMIGGLFIPTEQLDLSPIENLAVLEKWPFSIPFDILQTFKNLSVPGQAPIWKLPLPEYEPLGPLDVKEVVIDFNLFNPIANLVRILLSILLIIGICILSWKVLI